MSNGIEIEMVSQNPSSVSKCIDTEAVSSEEREQEPLLHTKKLEDWDSAQLKSRHTIFLSHSGAQKNFVEQLCEDLERAKQVPFFDKRPDSLPKGEKFAQLIFQAARQCQLAIVVVSEEYFSRSKWPMLELVAFVQAGKCTILPLFLGMSCKEFGDLKRRELWFERWNEWAQEDPRIQIDVWKEALRDLDGRNGLEYSEALGEVAYRKEVVATACTIVQKNLQLGQVMRAFIHGIACFLWSHVVVSGLARVYFLSITYQFGCKPGWENAWFIETPDLLGAVRCR